MADSPDRPKDKGNLTLPSVDAAMNRGSPRAIRGGKGAKDDDKNVRLGREDKEEEEAVVLRRARKRLARIASDESENRKLGLDDLRHETGEGQWPQDVAAQRNFDKRPCLTLNKLPTFVNQVLNDARQNRPGIHYSPVGERADKQVAQMLDGMTRAIWRNSDGDTMVDTALHNSAGAPGWGYARVLCDFEDEGSMHQEIRLMRVTNPFSVYLGKHKDLTGADANHAFVTEDMDREEFEETYPDADKMPWDQTGIGDAYKTWGNSESGVRIAEYFEEETEHRTLVQLSNGHVGFKDNLADEVKASLDSGALEVVKERESPCKKIWWYKLTAAEVLKKERWPGKYIPIVKFTGTEIDIEGKTKLSGIIRNAKQPQLMYNYGRTAEIETLGQQPKIVWLIAEGQDEGYEEQWSTAHVKARPALKYRPMSLGGHPVPPPQRQQPFGVPAGQAQWSQTAAQDMQAVTGIRFDATPQERMYDESGRALRELRERGDLATFHYIDNCAKSLRRLGVILQDLICNGEVYDTTRIVTILREDEKEQQVKISPTAAKPYTEERDEMTGKAIPVINPTIGKYGVTVMVGPSYATKRVEAAESKMDFVRAMGPAAPQIIAGVADLIAKDMDWAESEEWAARLAALVAQTHPGLIQPTQKDMTPQVQALIQGLQQSLQKTQQELMLHQRALADQDKDRAIKLEKIEKDFEAKLIQVAQKSDADMHKHVGTNLQNLMAEVSELRKALAEPTGAMNG